jgi:hypothetical protein
VNDFKSKVAKPRFKVRRFSASDFIPEVAHDELVFPGEAGVCREGHVREPWLGIDQADINRQFFFEKAAQRVPLLLRALGIALACPAHPRVDFVFDAVIRGSAHQELHNDLVAKRSYGSSAWSGS